MNVIICHYENHKTNTRVGNVMLQFVYCFMSLILTVFLIIHFLTASKCLLAVQKSHSSKMNISQYRAFKGISVRINRILRVFFNNGDITRVTVLYSPTVINYLGNSTHLDITVSIKKKTRIL